MAKKYVSVYFEFKSIKQKHNLRRNDECMDLIGRRIEKIQPIMIEEGVKDFYGKRCLLWGYYVWNDECTRKIGLRQIFSIDEKGEDSIKEIFGDLSEKITIVTID